jgi:thiosulfate/3-mercaptopyruvate sulfurtransferase
MRDANALVGTDELEAILGQSDLRIYDCTTYLQPSPAGSEDPYLAVPGLASFEAAHIPGADFLDLQGEFSDSSTHLRFMMPSADQLASAFARHGLGDGSKVVLYSIGTMMWATRFWWMLRSIGFDHAAILNGGFDKWRAEGRPTESGKASGYPPARLVARARPGLFTDKDAVRAAIGQAGQIAVNALGPQYHQGLEPSRYGRPGRIPGSVNVPAASLTDAASREFLPLDQAEAKFIASGITRDKSVTCYCGGGISATIDLFLLHQLGYDRLMLYDGSMGEWARDPALPIERD